MTLDSSEENLNIYRVHFTLLCCFLPKITFPLIYGIIVYWMTDQPAEFSRFMIFLVVCVQTALVGQSLGLVIGAATELEVMDCCYSAKPGFLHEEDGIELALGRLPTDLDCADDISLLASSFAGLQSEVSRVAVFLGPATGIPILLFSGFFVTLDAIPKYLQWLSYSSFTRYAFEGAMKVTGRLYLL
ncbi:unnamed protein product [Dibothriocephalus latus]|uniref:ABC-2 type transporter transmembrane domain-containing protein n=1 Tax=Dibothriocephalus latus TaxID=60516 RepID=A0A3P6TJF5_DIBLA|nr:unnamed protein product [Dibothriocephalus latus]